MMQQTASILKTAQAAFDAFAHGWGTGDFQSYLEMLTDEFVFWYPTGERRGQFSGAEGRAQMIAKCNDHTAQGDRLTFNITHTTVGDRDVVFEFAATGVFKDQPYQGWNAIAFEVAGDKISGFREYFGDLGE